MNKITEPNEATTILLFGSQIEKLNKESLDEIQSTLQDGPAREWILKTTAELPDYWDTLAKQIPEITDALGAKGKPLLAHLHAWVQQIPSGNEGGDFMRELEALPSVVLSPLVVLTQLTQYRQYLELQRKASNALAETDIHAKLVGQNKASTLGFCMGLLGAFAIACAHTANEVDEYGAVAVRLAMVGGALIDAQDEWSKKEGQGPSKSFATAWRTAEQKQEMERVVDDLFPEAYISVFYDDARGTVTTTERAAPRLVRRLRAAGVTTAEVGLRGNIHSPKPDTKEKTEAFLRFLSSTPGLQLPDASHLALPTYTNAGDGKPVGADAGPMHEVALSTVFMQQCNWYGTFASVKTALLDPDSEATIATFGPDRCVPPTLVRSLGLRLVHFADLPAEVRVQPFSGKTKASSATKVLNPPAQPRSDVAFNDSDIAVVGMAINVAGAENLDEFAEMLKTGQSQHELITPDRIAFDTLFREGDKDPARKWYANFIRDSDAFDHKFFKRSPRESASTDPQQRLLLQAAYQAVEQSGYFTEATRSPRKEEKSRGHVGVFVGSPAVDYEHNVACHSPNAFTATGNLQSFLAGRVAHWFGWTGPAITIDTACSSSAVAIHMACRNLLTGECNAALAGGVALCTNPLWFQNLAGASFLSPTGQCKPFDAQADGFCRAEGIGCVFLKRMSDAIADGNPILGCIASSAVYQNQNCTPMFVPNSPSLTELFQDVIRESKVAPSDISLVEAHGTGTAVGDPAEYESIKNAVGGPGVRSTPLPIGSVKGHVGHAEGASGAVSLIKVLMMMNQNFIPPQASFTHMNPGIKASPSDMLEVVTSLRPWSDSTSKKALLNNYGACGSNAAMVVTQSQHHNFGTEDASIRGLRAANAEQQPRFPFSISGLDARSIQRYAGKLVSYLQNPSVVHGSLSLADISFNVDRICNPSLGHKISFAANSVKQLQNTLSQVAAEVSTESPLSIEPTKAERPVILCFGGQVSTYVGLDKHLYDSVAILRHHLDECDVVMKSFGLDSVFPGIFSSSPEEDPVRVQTMLFAIQYSSARSWIDCGLFGKIAAVVGHSFGELVALCISGVLSLSDAIRLVAGRARVIRESWGTDRGAMMAIEADAALAQELVADAGRRLSERTTEVAPAAIACYNGVRSFTLAGPTEAIDAVADTITQEEKFSAIKSKRLNVTNAFHSSLVDPLVEQLEEIGRDLTFNQPSIPLELATETRSSSAEMTAQYVPNHMRKPVFFCQAVQRLAEKYPSAIFLEAGSSSGITVMASRALPIGGSSHGFQPVKITNCNGLDGLTDATVSLWKQGLRVSFWPHHASQTNDYASLILPPYQFEKSRHWLDLKSPAKAIQEAATLLGPVERPVEGKGDDQTSLGLWSFIGYLDEQEKTSSKRKVKRARFRINTGSEEYKKFVSGHIIAQTAPICPGTLQVDMAIEALFSLHPQWKQDGLQPTVHDMVNHSPLCVDPSRVVWLDFKSAEGDLTQWDWSISSTSIMSERDEQMYVQGRIRVRSAEDPSYAGEFARFERLFPHTRALELLASAGDNENVEVLQGRNVYRTFGEFVDYADMYRGVRSVIGLASECAGRVVGRYAGQTLLDTLLDDSFSQVAGIWVNCMTDLAPGDMYIATGIDLSMRSPRQIVGTHRSQENWHVYVRNTRQSETTYLSDVFVFDAATSELAEVMLGIQYSRISKASMSRMLTKLTKDKSVLRTPTGAVPGASTPVPAAGKDDVSIAPGFTTQQRDAIPSAANDSKKQPKKKKEKKPASSGRPDISDEIRKLVATVAGMDVTEITLDTEVADIGIDSLMGMELAREVQVVFKQAMDQDTLLQATSVRQLVTVISGVLFGEGGNAAAGDAEADAASSESSSDEDDWSSSEGDTLATPPSGEDTRIPTPDPVKSAVANQSLELTSTDILECFGKVKMSTDQKLRQQHVDNVDGHIIAGTSRLCVALIVEAFEQLGCSLQSATKGDNLPRIPFQPEYNRLVEWLYSFLGDDARLFDFDPTSGQVTRTGVAVPSKSSEALMEDFINEFPDWAVTAKLIYHAGKPLAKILKGETDGIKILFGSSEGRELMAGHYRHNPFAALLGEQMGDFLALLANQVKSRSQQGTLKILEMGAGTGGTTQILVPLLASLNIQVEYTFTDLSSSMVAAARRTMGKQYPFMSFAVHDIEKAPAEDICGQHIIIASNAVHATHNLVESAKNVHSALRPDGMLMMLEQTEDTPLSNLIFGLFEGWWMFDDGRTHAVVPTERWTRDLQSAGFGHVDWTDGHLPENNIQRVVVALASGPAMDPLPISPTSAKLPEQPTRDLATREAEAENYVTEHTAAWATPGLDEASSKRDGKSCQSLHDAVVLVTGATGSLGSHLVAAFAGNPDVKSVVCVNRRKGFTAVETRQADAFSSRGISLSSTATSKLRILETDTSQPHLGIDASEYQWLVQNVTHIVHNAWPMSGTRPLPGFLPQFQTMRHLLDLARDAACCSKSDDDFRRIGFQLVTSIGVVGHAGRGRILEDRVPISAVLPTGYCEGKWVCERMLDETLHKYPTLFRPMVVRPGQIAGSTTSGVWNPIEHFPFMVKSAQSLRAWPDLDGTMQWVPVDAAAASISELLHIGNEENAPKAYPVYHIDNPVGQSWKEMSPILARALGIPTDAIVPYRNWLRRITRSPLQESENPASRIVYFLEDDYERMSCGGLILDTTKTKEHSKTMASLGPLSSEVVEGYVRAWKEMGFLSS
jgi:acyl transferase domain-containing protein/thioester reductase-like protein/acyl carrier protein/SAM-dependent methyltransferase